MAEQARILLLAADGLTGPLGVQHWSSRRVADRMARTIGTFIDHLERPRAPFAWTSDSDEILGNIQRRRLKQAPIQTIRLAEQPPHRHFLLPAPPDRDFPDP